MTPLGTGCRQIASRDCDGVDVRPLTRYLRRTVELHCAKCRAAMERLGADFTLVERRVADVPVATDRRRRVAQWIAHMTARDETGRFAA